MALQTSGAISLDQIHVEAGGTSGTQASLNDSDIRGLISVSSGSTMGFDDWYGASAGWTLVQGTAGTSIKGFSAGHGTQSAISGSSLTPNTLNGATIKSLYYVEVTVKGSTTRQLFMVLDGNRAANFFATIRDTPSSLPNQPLSSSNATRSYVSQYNYTSYSWILPSTPSNWDGSGSFTVTFT